MASSVTQFCKNYFQGFHDIYTFNKNDSYKNILGILKIVSYCTIVIPLFFGAVYLASSLIGRVTLKTNLSSEDQKVSSITQKTLVQSTEQKLDKFFKSPKKIQEIFYINGTKVGIIFNPQGKALEGSFSIIDHIALCSESAISEDVKKQIDAKKPSNCTYSTLEMKTFINGQPLLQALGF